MMGFAFWVHAIGICTFGEMRGVLATVLSLDPNMHLQVLVDTRRFSGSECHTLNTILDLRQLTLGIGKLVNRCFADLEVYMPNGQS